MRTFKVTLLYLASMFLASLLGAPRQAIDVYPRVGSTAPATIRVRVTIEPDAANRAFCLGYDGPQFRESCEDLDGDKAWRSRTVYFRDLPGGRYVAFLGVYRKGDKSPSLVVTPFCIQGNIASEPVSCVE